MVNKNLRLQKGLNVVQTAILSGAMILLLYLGANSVFGAAGVLVFALVVGILYLFSSSNTRFLIPGNAKELNYWQGPEFFNRVRELARRSGIEEMPRLFLVESAVPNAAATGTKEQPIILITRGLLNNLRDNEITAVLAHEMSHVKNHDLSLFRFIDIVRQLTTVMARAGFVMLLFGFPLILTGMVTLPIGFFLFMIGSPLIALLLQLALQRTREFRADLGAAEITGSPESLASALYHLDERRDPFWRMFFPFGLPRKESGYGQSGSTGSIFRSHPSTSERINRLMQLNRVG